MNVRMSIVNARSRVSGSGNPKNELVYFSGDTDPVSGREARSTNIPSPRTTVRRKFNACMRADFLARTGQRITLAGNRKPKRLEAAEDFHKTLNLPGPGVPA